MIGHLLALSGTILIAQAAVAEQKLDLKYYTWREENLKRMDYAECQKALKSEEVVFETKPSFLKEKVCDAKNLVSVKKFRTVEVTPPALMTCDLALRVSDWIDKSVRPEARKMLGTDLVKIRHSGTFACRKMRTLEFISEHAFSNAIDIPEFHFQGGKKITVLKGWKSLGHESDFLKKIHKSACNLFPVALGPAYDAHHRDHLHVDVGPLTLCK